MIPILGGLGAAVAWTIATLCSSRSSKVIGAASAVAWVMVVGFVISVPLAVAGGIPKGLYGEPGLWLALSGCGNVAGLLLAYAAMRRGQVALVAPLISTEGAIAAVIAIAAGESVRPAVAGAVSLIVIGVVLSSISRGTPAPTAASPARAPAFALAAAMVFGVGLYATARAGVALPSTWVVSSARLVGAVGVALPLASRGQLLLRRGVVPLLVASGACEVLGFYAYISGSRHGIAVAAVLASQFASFTVVASYVLFGERLARLQLAGVAIVVIGVTLLSTLQA